MGGLRKSERSFGRTLGPSPSENKFYILVMFDIASRRKYTLLVRLLKRYSHRIQNSVFEGHLKPADIKMLLDEVEKLMQSERYFDPNDKVRIYKISAGCRAIIFGECETSDDDLSSDIFI